MLTQQWVFVGLQNYLEILPDPEFIAAFGRTAYFAGVTVAGGLILGMAMALVLNQDFPGRNFLRSVVLVPWAMAPVAVGVLWGWMFNGEYGTLNAILFDLGLIDRPIHWLADGDIAFNLVALVHVWNQAPLASLLILAGLQSIPDNLHRAARIDGAGAIRRFFSITLPWLRPMLLLILILTTINSIMAFDLFWIMTRGGPGSATTVFSWMGYAYAFQFFKFGEGAAILYVLTILCLILAALYLKLFFPTVTGGKPLLAADASASAAPRESLATSLVTRIAATGALARTRLERLSTFRRRSLLSGALRRRLGRTGLTIAAVLIFLWSFAPFVWLVLMSLSPSADLVRSPPTVVPAEPDPRELPLRPVSGRGRGRPVERAGDARALLDLQQPGGRGLRHRDQPGARLARRLRLRPPPEERAHERHAVGADDDPHDAGAGPDPAVLHRVPHA